MRNSTQHADICGGLKINGRMRYYRRIRAIEDAGHGKYKVQTVIGDFLVEGGKRAGGTRRDWFLDPAPGNTLLGGTINCTSLMDALQCIDTM